MDKKELINSLMGEVFFYKGHKCTIGKDGGTHSVNWLIKKSWFGEKVIQAHKLTIPELLDMYNQVYE